MVIVLALAVAGCAGTTAPATSPAATTAGLKAGLPDLPGYGIVIVGGNESPVTVTYADLKGMGFVETGNVTMVKANGDEVTGDFIGVPMAEVLAKAGVPDGDVAFELSASDGYVMLYTRGQIESAVLGLKRNGTALGDDIGGSPIQMVVPGERGAMWMKVPVRIEIEKR